MKPYQLRILLVEDDDSTAHALRSYLSASLQPLECVIAPTQQDLRALLRRKDAPYDVAILDYRVPREPGSTPEENPNMLAAIRERQPDIPVIHTTAFLGDADLAEMVKREAMGGQGFTRSAIVSKADPEWPTQVRSLLQHAKSTLHASAVGDLGSDYSSCFISFSHKDEQFARLIYDRLYERGIRLWFAPEDMMPGQQIHDQIEHGVRNYDRLILVLSENSMNSSWVESEIRIAIAEEQRSGAKKLVPVRLVSFDAIRNWKCFDSDSGRDLAVEVRKYFIPDFSNLNSPDTLNASINRLCDALRTK